jgi:hypothetical protein
VLLGEGIDAWPFWEPGFQLAFRSSLMPSRRGIPFVVEPWSDDHWALGAASLVLSAPFDVVGLGGDQGRMVRVRLQASGDGDAGAAVATAVGSGARTTAGRTVTGEAPPETPVTDGASG